jgi:hypothetical protein
MRGLSCQEAPLTTLYITAYESLAQDARGRTVQAGLEPALMPFTVTFTTAAAGSTQISTISGTVSVGGITRALYLRMTSTGNFVYKFATVSTTSATTTNGAYLTAGAVEFVGVGRDGLWISALGIA